MKVTGQQARFLNKLEMTNGVLLSDVFRSDGWNIVNLEILREADWRFLIILPLSEEENRGGGSSHLPKPLLRQEGRK